MKKVKEKEKKRELNWKLYVEREADKQIEVFRERER